MTNDSTTLTAIVTEEGKVRRAILQRQPDGQYVEIDSGPLILEYSLDGSGVRRAQTPPGRMAIMVTAPKGTA